MASVDPIDISSSDSEFWEIDNYIGESPDRDVTSSINPRSPTTWTPSAHPNLTDYNSVSRKSPYSPSSSSSQRKVVHDDMQLRPLKQLNSAEIIGPSTSKANGNVHQRFGSSNDDGYDSSCEMISSQPRKRTISEGLQTSIPGMGLNNPVENVSASKIRETFGTFNQLGTRLLASNGRQLPLSLMPGQKPSTTHYAGFNDSFHHTELAQEGRAGDDERFVFQAAVQDLHQPKLEATLPDGLLTVPLLRHQKIALAWMLSKESSGLCLGGILADDQGLGKTVSTIALMQMQRTLEAKSKSKCNSRTEALNLDDDDGNGGCVALDDPGQIDGSGEYTILPEANNALKGFQSRRPMAGTLIVCPASVIRQWARELREKVYYKAKLQVLTYHGGSRTKDPAMLAENDVVLTTYAIVTNEVPKQPLVDEDEDAQNDGERHGLSSAFSMEKKRKKSFNKKQKKGKREIDVSAFDSNCGTLAKVKWSRVVLDECQMIKNHRTQVARACCSLRAKRRWCLSGTPMQNSVDELFSYFRFLRYDPYDKYKTFSSSIKGLIARDSAKGYKKLQVVLRNIMLRRTKGTLLDGEPIITLPPKQIYLTRVEFSSEERAFYDKLEADSRKQFKAYAAAGTLNQNYANILLMLLRLRQACDHPLLVKGLSSDPVGKVSTEMAKILPKDLLINLYKQLETSLAICLACRDPPENAVVTMCGHVFCYQCVSDHLTGEDNTCPAPECKEQLGADVVYSRSTLRRSISGYNDDNVDVPLELDMKCSVLRRDFISSKIRRALDILKSHCIRSSESCDLIRYDGDASSSSGVQSSSGSGGREKAIVFSQWTSMLDLVEMSLKNSLISYRRLDGTMSIAARDKAVKDFNTDTEVDVMLMSLKAGNLGLNMVAACRIILLDLWWNPTTEDQAIDRAHRIGQTRPVTVSRITIKDTVEDRILTLQEDKRKMVASAFGEDQTGGHGTRLTVDDLRFLFEGSEASRR